MMNLGVHSDHIRAALPAAHEVSVSLISRSNARTAAAQGLDRIGCRKLTMRCLEPQYAVPMALDILTPESLLTYGLSA